MRTSVKQVAQAWYTALKTLPTKEASEYSENILSELYRDGHARWLPELMRLIDEFDKADRECISVQVKSAHPVPEKVIMDFLREHLPAKKYDVETMIDPALIGGLQIQTSEKRWNISLEERLKQLHHSVSNSSV